MRDYKKLYKLMLDDEFHKQLLRDFTVKSLTSQPYIDIDVCDDVRLCVELNDRNELEYMDVNDSGAGCFKSRKEMIEHLWRPEYDE